MMFYLRPISFVLLLTSVCAIPHVNNLKRLKRNLGTRGHQIIGPDPSFNCPGRGVFPHPILCNYYYECWGSVALLGYCTEDQLFDLNYDGCNWPEYVDCGDRFRPSGLPGTQTPPFTGSTTPTLPSTTTTTTPTTTTTTTTTPAPTFDCPTQFGAYPNQDACEYYWQCFDWESTLVLCADNQLFDLRYLGCNFDFLTACQDRPRPPGANATVTPPDWMTTTTTTSSSVTTPTTRSTTTESPGFACPEPTGSFADPADCASFYVCQDGVVAGHQTCPDGLLWNDRLKNCDFAWNVDCPA